MATEIEQQLNSSLKDAMRAGDEVRREAIRMLISALKYESIALRRPLTDEDVEQVILRIAKRHRDSIAEFKKGNRPDLVAHEEAQLKVVEQFAQQQMMSRDEIEVAVRETMAGLDVSGPRAMGPIMTALSAKLRDKADMRLVNEVVREILAASGTGSR
ncbi:MAG TPA: GatB/YqeY domain-containing protein [Chloroflexota bacterium]|nr:GatB/YqeY domain-containing protein [Chloroflexota bacterium]